MKLRSLSLLCLFFGLAAVSHAQTLRWPIAGKTAGDNIVSRPQDAIGEEKNFDDLFISGKEGDVVISPADGTVKSVGITYYKSLSYAYSFGYDPSLSWDRNIDNIEALEGTNKAFYVGSLSITMGDGNKVHICGLAGDYKFRTGQKVSEGDTLGVVSYSFKAFKEPTLMISFSDAASKSIDPMKPFGLRSTFIEPATLKRDNPLSVEKAKEDLTVLEDAICELYPSLDKVMTEEEFRSFMDSLKASVTKPVDPLLEMRSIIRTVLHKVPDSHFSLHPDPLGAKGIQTWLPGEFLYFCNDTARIMTTVKGFGQYEGMVVTKVNGEDVKDIAERARKVTTGYDANVESTAEEELVLLGSYSLKLAPAAAKGSVHELEFADGSKVTIPFESPARYLMTGTSSKLMNWYVTNLMRGDDDVFETRTLNDSTAYLGIKTFDMLDTQVEQIGAFLKDCKAENLIVDVRNNYGGENKVLMRLLSFFADAPLDKQDGGYSKVKGTGHFASMKYSTNYSPEEDVFFEYQKKSDGYYYRTDSLETCAVVVPDPNIHYPGKVYVLTNGHSISAAMLFPAVLVRNRRAVSVGRETGSGYHSMTAFKFAKICLPNSLQTVEIPLVQLNFDNTVSERFPEGRGLLPDYPVTLTHSELVGDGDAILDRALSLIADGKYLSDEAEEQPAGIMKYMIIALSVLLVCAAIYFIFCRKKRKLQ